MNSQNAEEYDDSDIEIEIKPKKSKLIELLLWMLIINLLGNLLINLPKK